MENFNATFPLGLRNALESGNCVLFLGAGIGHNLFDSSGLPAPDGTKLAEELASYFKVEGATETHGLAKIAQVVEYRFGRTNLDSFIKKRLSDLTPDEHVQWLTTLRWRAIFTTNYDNAILRAYEMNANPPQQPVAISSTAEIVHCNPRVQVPVYFLHGTIVGAETRLIITDDDYAKFRERRNQLFELLKLQFAQSTILYIGYSNRDPNWRMVLEELRAEFAPSATPQSYRVVKSSDKLDTEILQRKAVETIECTLEEFHRSASVALDAGAVNGDNLEAFRNAVPSQLSGAFDATPAAVVRLLGAWEYCNAARFEEAPNTRDFYRGDRANWGLVSRGIAFKRDVEDVVYDWLLDYATSGAKSPVAAVILGSAGYGVSTVLRSIVARSVGDRIGNVFFLRDGQVPGEGDTEFAASLESGLAPIFIIDVASKYAQSIRACIQRLKDLGLRAIFIMGARLNQWHETVGRAPAREFVIDQLSDEEINRLLDALTQSNELGVLSELSREFQFSAIKSKYQKELLVALREATEGRLFDAIIDDEYRGLNSELARKAYLIVSGFFQAGVYIRDTLLADLLGLPLSELYTSIAGPTEGVVVFDIIDEASGSYGARARHQTIAAIVWERCGSTGERQWLITEALNKLNLNYQVDSEAFWAFVQSVQLVDELRTLDDRIKFFETACQKDPSSPYVRQHYSRMFRRADHLQLALKEVDAAIALNSNVKVLHHTRGLVLSDLANEAPSEEIARRILIQCEDAYNRCISLDRRDEYGYSGLAEAYLRWAKRVSMESERNDYIAKAESMISEGLKNTRSHEKLWIVSSEIEAFLGFDVERIKALELALGSVVASRSARYLLGRYYRSVGRPRDAIEILKPALDNFPDDYRIFIEYANAMLGTGESYEKAAAVLRLASLTGMRDARYIANLGGMLFMASEYSAAESVFKTTLDRNFSFEEATRTHLYPKDSVEGRKNLRQLGIVAAVKGGYSFIDSGDRPSFFFAGTKAGDSVLKEGMQVEFEPAFSARGQTAQRLTIVSSSPRQDVLF